jgi:hypothetical protein
VPSRIPSLRSFLSPSRLSHTRASLFLTLDASLLPISLRVRALLASARGAAAVVSSQPLEAGPTRNHNIQQLVQHCNTWPDIRSRASCYRDRANPRKPIAKASRPASSSAQLFLSIASSSSPCNWPASYSGRARAISHACAAECIEDHREMYAKLDTATMYKHEHARNIKLTNAPSERRFIGMCAEERPVDGAPSSHIFFETDGPIPFPPSPSSAPPAVSSDPNASPPWSNDGRLPPPGSRRWRKRLRSPRRPSSSHAV